MKREDLTNLMPQEILMIARVAQSLMLVLNARLFTLLSLCFAAAGFGWCMWIPDWTRFAAACAFAILVFLPLSRMEAKRIAAQSPEGE